MRKNKAKKSPGQIARCEDEVTLIGDYLSSNLSAQVATAFETHMQACPDCVAFLRTYKKTIEATRAFLKINPVRGEYRRLLLRPLGGSGSH